MNAQLISFFIFSLICKSQVLSIRLNLILSKYIFKRTFSPSTILAYFSITYPHTGVRLGHIKNALVGVLTIAMYTLLMSAFSIIPGHMKNKVVGVVYIVIVKHPRVHSSYDQVLPPCHN